MPRQMEYDNMVLPIALLAFESRMQQLVHVMWEENPRENEKKLHEIADDDRNERCVWDGRRDR